MSTFLYLLPYFGVALLGNAAHILTKLAKIEMRGDIAVKPGAWLKAHKYATILGVIISLLGVFLYFGIDQLSWATAVVSGYACDSVMKNGMSAMGWSGTKRNKTES